MMRTLDLRGVPLDRASLRDRLPRAAMDVEAASAVVAPVVEQVRRGGVEAIRQLGERFDGVAVENLRVPADALDEALESLDPRVRAALAEAIRRARIVHGAQRRDDVVTRVCPGGTITQRWLPVERVGLYVPGGLAVYPSSVVMNVVPAQEAGVTSLAVSSPPQPDHGGVHPTILAACRLLGVGATWREGPRAGEIECAPVDLVTGPGNIYVAAAKRLLRGVIGIDAEAGPTEIAVLADSSADPRHVAADLISQAEHDPNAASVLVTDSLTLAQAVLGDLDAMVAATKHTERIGTALSGPQSAIVLVDDIDAGVVVVNAYAAEHLEIQTVDCAERAAQIRHAGAVFVGAYAPVSLGDYVAGSNHVLPTAGSARHASGLSVQSFLRGVQVIDYSRSALAEVAPHVTALSGAEDLPAHGEAVSVRLVES
jgi:histidinol dehydrogenase